MNDRLWWGLIPYWCKEEKGGRKPINAKAETIATLPTFRDAYAKRRCILPIDNFFEWKAIKGEKVKQPYAIAVKSGEPFGLAGDLGELEAARHRRMGSDVRGDHLSSQ